MPEDRPLFVPVILGTKILDPVKLSAADLTVAFQAPNGNAKLPASVTIPAGASSASFPVSGLRAGVEEVTAVPGDATYETAFARVQVADASERVGDHEGETE